MFRIVVVLAVLGSPTAFAAPIKVYIIAGQSNAVGASAMSMLEPELSVPQDSLYQFALHTSTAYLESENWEQLRVLNSDVPGTPDPYPGTNYGAELSFGQAMQRRLGERIAVIKVGANGTSLGARWLPSHDDLYPWMINKVQSSLGQLQGFGYEPSVEGFLWIQHEGDAAVALFANDYDDYLMTFASTVRADLGVPGLPFLINQAHADLARNFTFELRQSQANAVAADPLMRMFNTDDLGLNPDNVHFTGTTQIEIGRRFADLLMPSADFDNDGAVDGADLVAWRGSFGSTRVGDGDADGLSDGADFLMWQRQLGAGSSSVAVIPEPGSLSIFLLGACLASRWLFSRQPGNRAMGVG